jgi:hypothetical protein
MCRWNSIWLIGSWDVFVPWGRGWVVAQQCEGRTVRSSLLHMASVASMWGQPHTASGGHDEWGRSGIRQSCDKSQAAIGTLASSATKGP